MKKELDPRHVFRKGIIQALYSKTFEHTTVPPLSAKQKAICKDIEQQQEEINTIIDTYATTFDHTKMAKVDYAILQQGVYELLFTDKPEPYKVVIDEAVELAKEYGSDSSSKLVNGILAKAYSDHATSEK
ncbi:hypothetical protein COU89_01085 [Candidatus Roizmanbacteria bacterium CG10_big_fil_rev_8_21_14_0_10_45_7]|uniref:NusB/RsmB/TIM44 domain-containing protein n=1 Tax=Candidatus Roizmanbacteria bacterium CG10_big_fil_rev_8_21_14_0_10_45_7 TaxID=1974854 RepID=A0A2M8KV65_9BACT|nr:MAG: hypothetical protein COU89_01085 [Candidatus Roizmanbacteria bacterium CG10_big_fil_rev_8_21_14_0_10_45_7]